MLNKKYARLGGAYSLNNYEDDDGGAQYRVIVAMYTSTLVARDLVWSKRQAVYHLPVHTIVGYVH